MVVFSKNPGPDKPAIKGKTPFEYEQVQKRRAAENAPTKKSPIDYMKIKKKDVKESRSFNDFLNRDIEESETPVPQEKKFDHNSAILKWELEAVGIRTKNTPIVENPTPKIDYDEVAKSIFEKHKAKEVPVTIPTKFQEAIEKREKGNATLTKAFYDEYK